MYTRVKICCISSLAEADLAISCGASALGLVSKMPSGPGVIPDDLIKAIALSTPPPIATFLAGGLTAENVQQAIDEVQPFGIDLCSGVRTNNQLDPVKLENFFKRIR